MAPQPSPAFPVRQATSADAPTIAELAAELGYHVGVDDVRQRLAALPATHIVLVATDQQRVVGWLHAFHGHSVLHGDRVEIAGLAVAGNRQGQGVGTALITHLETVGSGSGRPRHPLAVRQRTSCGPSVLPQSRLPAPQDRAGVYKSLPPG
jgi:N-acetylglutamate synthase-like GNAT family acetyltransferase